MDVTHAGRAGVALTNTGRVVELGAYNRERWAC
jgi:hypothetical protein